MKSSHHFPHTKFTTTSVQHSLYCCSSSHSKHYSTKLEQKQGRIHGNPVTDDLAGAIMGKPLAIQNIKPKMDTLAQRAVDFFPWSRIDAKFRVTWKIDFFPFTQCPWCFKNICRLSTAKIRFMVPN